MPNQERDERRAAPRTTRELHPDDVRPEETRGDEPVQTPPRPDPSPDDFPEG